MTLTGRLSEMWKPPMKVLLNAGYEAYLVGGAPRDLLMGREPNDYDFATDATPDQIMTLFKRKGFRCIDYGAKHGTIKVVYPNGLVYDITTYRVEEGHSDGRRPDAVRFVKSIKEDLARRDFTIGALAMRIDGSLIDYFGGVEDVLDGRILAVGDPEERFLEDGLRVWRAFRFAGKLGFDIDSSVTAAMKLDSVRAAEASAKVSPERVRDEVMKMMDGIEPVRGIRAAIETGYFFSRFPEMEAAVDMPQPTKYHAYSVLEHSVQTLSWGSSFTKDPLLRFVMLFHDIGKPETYTNETGNDPHFYGHESVGAAIMKRMMQRLKFTNADIERASHLVRHHLVRYRHDWTDTQVRRWVRKVGIEHVDDLITLNRADLLAHGTRRGVDEAYWLDELRERIARIPPPPPVLAVDGYDLMTLGLKGPAIGAAQKMLIQLVDEDPSLNERSVLIEQVQKAMTGGKNDSEWGYVLYKAYQDYKEMTK